MIDKLKYPENGEKAIVLASGGSKVAYEAAILYVMRSAGWFPRYVLGVSAGAISGGAYSMGRLDQMIRILYDLDERNVHRKRSVAGMIAAFLWGKITGRDIVALHDNAPIAKIIRRELENHRIRPDVVYRAGRVNLEDGAYTSETFTDGHRAWRQILASATIPVYWPAVDDPTTPGKWVDGGVRDMAPLGDLFDMEREAGSEIGQVLVIGTERLSYKGGETDTILDVAKTAAGIALKEILMNDIKSWELVNAIVRQAEERAPGIELTHPRSGRPLRSVELVVSEPTTDLGKGSDFSNRHFRDMLAAGERDGIRIFYGEDPPASYVPMFDMILGGF